VLFFGVFCYFFLFFFVGPPLPGRGLIVVFFGVLLFFGLFSVAPLPLEIFMPTPLGLTTNLLKEDL